MPNKDIFFHQYVSQTEQPAQLPLLFRLLRRFEKHRYQAIIESLALHRKHTVLDIGCGAGEFLTTYQKYWKKAVGIDVVPELIQKARSLNSNKSISFTTHSAGAKKLPFAAGAFSVVTSIATLQYIDDLDLFVRDVHRVLDKDGLFIFEVPNFLVIWRRLQLLLGNFPRTSLFHAQWDGGVIHYFTYDRVESFF